MNAQQQQTQQNPCMAYTQYFLTCLKQNADNINMCQMKMDMLSQCEKDYGMNQGIWRLSITLTTPEVCLRVYEWLTQSLSLKN